MLKKFIPFLFVIVLSLVTIVPLFEKGLFPIHDDTQVARVIGMEQALRDGMFPVRMSNVLGYNYGYPIFNFYAPFAYYVGGVSDFITHDPILATKIMMGLAMLVAGISMFLLARSLWGMSGGVVSSVLYVFAPYHALNLYVRGAVAELWAYAFLPLPFWGIYRFSQTHKYRYLLVTAFSFAAIIISHNLTGLMVTPFLLLSCILVALGHAKKDRRRAVLPFAALLLGILLSAFYAVPAFFEMKYTNITSILGGQSNPLDHFVCLSQLWQSQWGYGGSAPGCVDGMSFMIGKIHILLTLLGVFAAIYLLKKKDREGSVAVAFSLFVFIISVFLMLSFSESVWKSLSFMQYFQFPWRFLSLVSFSSSVIGGGILYTFLKIVPKSRFLPYVLGLFFVISSLIYYGKYFKPQHFITDTSLYTDKSVIAWNVSKISEEYLPQNFPKPKTASQVPTQVFAIEKGEGVLSGEVNTTTVKSVQVESAGGVVHLNLAYFPAWTILLDNHVVSPTITHNLYSLSVPQGKHQVTAEFRSTPLERVANTLSIVGLFIAVTGIILLRRAKLL